MGLWQNLRNNLFPDHASLEELARPRRRLTNLVLLLRETCRSIDRHQSLVVSSALAFKTLVALVPTLAISIAILSMLGAYTDAEGHTVTYSEEFISALAARLPDNPMISNLFDYVRVLSQKAASIAGVGFLLLFITAFSLLYSIEQVFNTIWQVRKARPLLNRAMAYLSTLIVVPVLIAFSVYLNSQLEAVALRVSGAVDRAERAIGDTMKHLSGAEKAGPSNPTEAQAAETNPAGTTAPGDTAAGDGVGGMDGASRKGMPPPPTPLGQHPIVHLPPKSAPTPADPVAPLGQEPAPDPDPPSPATAEPTAAPSPRSTAAIPDSPEGPLDTEVTPALPDDEGAPSHREGAPGPAADGDGRRRSVTADRPREPTIQPIEPKSIPTVASPSPASGAAASASRRFSATASAPDTVQNPYIRAALVASSLVVTCLAFAVLFYLIPNTQVKWGAALAGGVFTGVLVDGTKIGFRYYAIHASQNLEKIYGPVLLSIPLTLFWIWLLWTLVLIGAEISFTLQNFRDLAVRAEIERRGLAYRVYLAVRLVLGAGVRLRRGEHPETFLEELAEELRVPPYLLQELASRLQDRGLLRRLAGEGEAWLPAKDISALSLGEVVRAIQSDPLAVPEQPADVVQQHLGQLFHRIESNLHAELDCVTIAQLVDALEGPVEAPQRVLAEPMHPYPGSDQPAYLPEPPAPR